MKLSYEQIVEARKMRQRHMSWQRIADAFGCSAKTVRRPLDQEWSAKRAQGIREARRYRNARRAKREVRMIREAPSARPSQEMLDARQQPATIGQLILGDPLPGRSALDRRQAST